MIRLHFQFIHIQNAHETVFAQMLFIHIITLLQQLTDTHAIFK